MNKLSVFSELAVSGARLLKETYNLEPITPKGLIEIIIFNLYIVSNEYRLIHGKQVDDPELRRMEYESFSLLRKDLSLHMSIKEIDSFINDRMEIYHREYLKIARETNPVAWDAVYYLFYKRPLGEYPSPIQLLKSDLFNLVLFGEAMLNQIRFLKEMIGDFQIEE